jgi:phosphatidylglycerophosphatase A
MSRKPASLADRVARGVATAGGLGYAPVAPGSLTSLPVALAVWGFRPSAAGLLAAAAAVAVLGVWAAGREAARVGTPDPGSVVVDEVAGMLVALVAQPTGLPWVLGRLPGGWGIVADDLAAGLCANLVGQLRRVLSP